MIYMIAMSAILAVKYIFVFLRFDLPSMRNTRAKEAMELRTAEINLAMASNNWEKGELELSELRKEVNRKNDKFQHDQRMESWERHLKKIEYFKTEWQHWAERELRALKGTIGEDDAIRKAKFAKVEEKFATAKKEDVQDLVWEEQKAFQTALNSFKKTSHVKSLSKEQNTVMKGAVKALDNLSTLQDYASDSMDSSNSDDCSDSDEFFDFSDPSDSDESDDESDDSFDTEEQMHKKLLSIEEGFAHRRRGNSDLPRLMTDSCTEESCHRVWYSNNQAQMRKRSLSSDVTHRIYFTPNDYEFAPRLQRRNPISEMQCREQQTFSTSKGDLFVMTAWRSGPDSDALGNLAHQSVDTLFKKTLASIKNNGGSANQKRDEVPSIGVMSKECLSFDDQSKGEPALWGFMHMATDPAKLEDDLDADFTTCQKKLKELYDAGKKD